MATGRCIPCEKPTAALKGLPETVCAGGPHADCVTAVYVFGSYARGALNVGDVDTDIECDAKLDPGVEREMLQQPRRRRLEHAVSQGAQAGARPARDVQPPRNAGRARTWSTSAATRAGARARADAIAPDPAAGRAKRDPVHGAIEPVAEDLARPSRIMRSELIGAGLLAIDVIDLVDAVEEDIADRVYCREVRMRWRNSSSPLARAARAAGRYLEAADVDLGAVALMPKGVLGGAGSAWAVDCRETHLRRLVIYLGYHGITNGLFVCARSASGRCARCG